MLVGRRSERDALDRLLDTASRGRSGVLVLSGEPGVGKTALVDYVVASAPAFRVARTVGVESEVELAFAALQHLCGPLLDRLEHLPGPQQDALRAAFGLQAGSVPERFLVGLAALSLLSDAAREQPLLCVVDDAQWLDRESAQALAFVARRLLAEPVALLFATRNRTSDLDGLPELTVRGLGDADARALLASVIEGPLDERVQDRIVTETQGNPLALLELPRGLTPAELAVGFHVHASLPLSGRIEESFRRRVDQLPIDSRRLLLIASADQLGDSAKVWRAAELEGVGARAAQPAAAAGLLDIDTRVRFRHPLVRSAVYRAASPEERRAVHQALADSSDRELDRDRRAWHLAEAASGPDEDVAGELECSAGQAQQRGGLAAAAAYLERSAELTPDRGRRALRLLSAARAHMVSGANERARGLLEDSAPFLSDPAARAQAMRMEGAIRFADGRGGETPRLLLDAAMALRELDPELAREALVDALQAAMWAGPLTTGTTVLDVAAAARGVPAPDTNPTLPSLLLRGFTERLTTGYPAAVECWRRAAAAYADHRSDEPSLQWDGMAWTATGELFDFERHIAVARHRVRLAREQGALATLPVALGCLAWNERLAGRIDTADSLIAESFEITAATGAPAMPGAQGIMQVATLAWRGREQQARLTAEAVIAEAVARGQGLGVTLAQLCLTTLELGLGRYEEARILALEAYEQDALHVGGIHLPDAIEATVRAGDLDAAQAALARLSERALASGTPWALGLLARSRALLARDAEAEMLYEDALDHLGRSGVVTDFARTRLLYGEWLRRRRRRRDARVQLRLAHDMLQATGAVAFAHRASVELLATGEHARRRVVVTRDQLTPQEQQVAQLAAGGESNAEIAAQLFISPHTVAYHLRKVFGKLSITSRTQLAAVIGELFETGVPT